MIFFCDSRISIWSFKTFRISWYFLSAIWSSLMLLTLIEIEKNMNQKFFEMFIILKWLKLTLMFLSTFCVSDSRQKSSIDFKWLKFMFLSLMFRIFSLVISFLVINWSTLNEIRLWLKIIIIKFECSEHYWFWLTWILIQNFVHWVQFN